MDPAMDAMAGSSFSTPVASLVASGASSNLEATRGLPAMAHLLLLEVHTCGLPHIQMYISLVGVVQYAEDIYKLEFLLEKSASKQHPKIRTA